MKINREQTHKKIRKTKELKRLINRIQQLFLAERKKRKREKEKGEEEEKAQGRVRKKGEGHRENISIKDRRKVQTQKNIKMIIKEYYEHPYDTKFENLSKTYYWKYTKCQISMKGNRKLEQISKYQINLKVKSLPPPNPLALPIFRCILLNYQGAYHSYLQGKAERKKAVTLIKLM